MEEVELARKRRSATKCSSKGSRRRRFLPESVSREVTSVQIGDIESEDPYKKE